MNNTKDKMIILEEFDKKLYKQPLKIKHWCGQENNTKDIDKEFDEKFEDYFDTGSPSTDDPDRGSENEFYEKLKSWVVKALKEKGIEEYKKGYNACLKDFKIPNEFGEKSL